jgi:hypothetical protein
VAWWAYDNLLRENLYFAALVYFAGASCIYACGMLLGMKPLRVVLICLLATIATALALLLYETPTYMFGCVDRCDNQPKYNAVNRGWPLPMVTLYISDDQLLNYPQNLNLTGLWFDLAFDFSVGIGIAMLYVLFELGGRAFGGESNVGELAKVNSRAKKR